MWILRKKQDYGGDDVGAHAHEHNYQDEYEENVHLTSHLANLFAIISFHKVDEGVIQANI